MNSTATTDRNDARPKAFGKRFLIARHLSPRGVNPDKDYDSRWLAWLLRPGIYDAMTPAQERTEIEDWLDPARVEIELKLIPADYIETYAANTIDSLADAIQSLCARSSGGGMMLMRLPAADSNIVFQAITRVTNGSFPPIRCLEGTGKERISG